MSRAAKHSKPKNPLMPVAVVATVRDPASTPTPTAGAQNGKGADGTAPEAKAGKGIAVLALGDAGEILAARDACEAVFGWDPTELIGKNIHVLLKDGLDNEVGRFLHRHRAGMNPAGTIEMNVVALRKDGSEFPAQVTTLTFNWGTTDSAHGNGDTSRLSWTAGFRDLSPETESVPAKPAPAGKSKAAPATKPAPELHRTRGPAGALTAALGPIGATTPAAAKAPAPAETKVPAKAKGSTKPETAPAQQVAGYESSQRVAELEEQLAKLMAELTAAKADNEKLGCGGAELQAALDSAKEATGHTEAALREETARREKLEERFQNLSNQLRVEQAERSQRFGEELVSLRNERDELNLRLAAEKQAAIDSTHRAQELEASIKAKASEFEKTKAELERQTADRERAENSWREQLDTAWIAKRELEGAWAGAVERNKLFEEELAKLRQEHDELTQKLTAEQQAAADSTERAKEVESRLSRNAADSDRARTELEKDNAERKRIDDQWRQQLDAATSAKAQLETSLAEMADKTKQLEENLAALRRENDELQNQVKTGPQSTAETDRSADEVQRRLDQQVAEVERLTAELERQSAERQEAETRVADHETAFQSRAKELEADWAAAMERNVKFEEELVTVRQECFDLKQKLALDQQTAAELEQVQRELEAEKTERLRADDAWRDQLEAANTLKAQFEVSLEEATEQARRLEQEISALQMEREELESRVKNELQSAEQSTHCVDELQRKLEQGAAELDRLTAELEHQRAERQQTERQAGEENEAALARAQKLESDWSAAVERNVHFEEELARIRKERDDLAVQVKTEQRASADAAHQAAELQRRLQRSAADLQKATTEADKKRSEKERVESEGRGQLETAKALARKLDAAWTAATERSRRFESEVAGLRQERTELQGKLSAAQREAAHFKALAAQRENEAKLLAGQDRSSKKVETRRANPTQGVPLDAARPVRDLQHSNGHGKPPTDNLPSARPAGSNGHGEPKAHPASNGHHGKPAPAQPVPPVRSTPPSRPAGDVQQYNFSPARSQQTPASGKRLEK